LEWARKSLQMAKPGGTTGLCRGRVMKKKLCVDPMYQRSFHKTSAKTLDYLVVFYSIQQGIHLDAGLPLGPLRGW
jgi:hypothetical protein